MRLSRVVIALAAAGTASLGLLASSAHAASAVHEVTATSKGNFSGAVEDPTWSFACNGTTGKYTFTINDVQVFDATHHTWDGSQGPWALTVFAALSGGPVPFSIAPTLHQNTTNGLFTVKSSGTVAKPKEWCATGAGVSVVGFSHENEPLLLDGTLS